MNSISVTDRLRASGRRASRALAICALTMPAIAAGPVMEQYLNPAALARLRPVIKTGSFSSYDRTGANDDGFSGKYSFLRREAGGLVLAELNGPGALTRIATPTPTEDPVEFYFDGEAQPRLRLKFADLFSGKVAPFLAPFAGSGAGGYYCYVPLEFARSMKVVLRAEKFQFYQINYALYEPGVPAKSCEPGWTPVAPAIEKSGQEIAGRVELKPGSPVKIFATDRPGRITSLRLGPSSALAGGARRVTLRIFWDGSAKPAVEVPAGDFFGYSFGRPAIESMLAGTRDGMNYCYLPMPFDRSARIELEAADGPAVSVDYEVRFAPQSRRSDEGRFHAVWRRENPTRTGAPFTFVDVKGRGHMVGAILQAQGSEPGNTYFFEGDDEATIDGELSVRGTGSEDFFNGGWYDLPGRWYGRVSLPFSGCLEYSKHLGRTGGYRFLLADAYTFRKSLRLTIEHGPEGNRIPTDYAAVTFLYLDEGDPAVALPAVAARAVNDPASFAVVPGWQEPISAFSFDNATLAKIRERVNGKVIRYLSLRKTGEPEYLRHFVAIAVNVPKAGRYTISLQGVLGPDNGIVQLLSRDQPIGDAVDLYAPEKTVDESRRMAVVELSEGANDLYVAMTGHNSASRGLGFDIIRIACERVP